MGAAGQKAGQAMLAAAPDGYTLMLHSDGHAVSAAFYGARLPHDTLRDMARVSMMASAPIVEEISAQVARAVQNPALRDRLAADGVTVRGTSPKEFDAYVRGEVTRLVALGDRACLRLE